MSINQNKKVSRDAGKTFDIEKTQTLMSEYFFLSDEHKVNYRYLSNILDLSSTFGGLYNTFIVPFFYFIGTFINSKIMKAKLIRALFLQDKSDIYKSLDKKPLMPSIVSGKKDIREDLWPIKFTLMDKISLLVPNCILNVGYNQKVYE